MPPSKPKNLLRAILNKNIPTIAVTTCATDVLIWTIVFENLQPDHDKNLMARFKSWLMEVNPHGRVIGLTIEGQDIDDVRVMIEKKIKDLVDVLKVRNIPHANALNDIMWRELFNLPPPAAVDIVITGAEDSSDSGNTVFTFHFSGIKLRYTI